MADMLLDPIMEKIIEACYDYLKHQFRWQTGMKKELERLRENHPKIQAVFHFASSQAQITEEYPALNKWLWQLRDAIDDAYDVVDELEYMELEKQVTKNKKLRSLRSMRKRLLKIGKRALKIDPTLKRLEEAVQKLHKVSTTGVDTFLHLVKHAKEEHQKQQRELHGAREMGSLLQNDLIGLDKDKEVIMEWLRNPSNEHRRTDLYRNISLLSIVGDGGMGKTALLQRVYEDEMTKEFFDLKMWVCVSNNFDLKKVIAEMLQYLKMERPRFETLWELQGGLKKEVMSKKFLLVLDDIWDEEDERDENKWEDVLAPLASGGFGSKILITTRMDAVALMFARLIRKKVEIVKLEGLDEDECLQLLNSHAFAGVENPSDDDHENLRVIARDIVKKLSRSPLAAKVIGGVLNDNLDERHWRTVLERNLLDQKSIHSVLRLSYIVLPNHLRNCFACCCMFPQDHQFDKDDLVRMWIALGFIHQSQRMAMEDIGGRYFDALVKKNLFDKIGDYYKMRDLIHESASIFFALKSSKFVDNEDSSLRISKTIRHLSTQTRPNILSKIEKFKHLHSLYLFYEDSNEDICTALAEIFKALRSLRILYIFAPCLKMIPEEIGNLIHLRYLKIYSQRLTMLPRCLSNLYHLQYIIHDSLGFPGQHEVDYLPGDINKLSNLRYLSIGPSVPMLRELPNLPPSLKYLSIWRCHPELKERYREDGGSDRHKIAHIPYISI